MTGESPTRPGILKKRPEVVATLVRSPWAERTDMRNCFLRAEAPAPRTSLKEAPSRSGALRASGRLDPSRSRSERRFFQRSQIFPGLRPRSPRRGKPWTSAKRRAPCADEEDAGRLDHARRATFDGDLDAGQGRDSSGPHRPALHLDGGVQLDDALPVRARRRYRRLTSSGLELDDVDAGDGGVERVLFSR